VQVRGLVFPVDFYIIDMKDENLLNSSPILLGRPFLRTIRTKIDMHVGILTMEFDGEIIELNIFNAWFPSDVYFVMCLNIIDSFVQQIFDLSNDDNLDLTCKKKKASYW